MNSLKSTPALPRRPSLRLTACMAACAALFMLAASGSAYALPPAVQVSPAGEQCQANILPGTDDGSTDQVPIGFPINFFGASYSNLYVNNNGNVTFDGPLATFRPEAEPGGPFGLVFAETKIIAVYFADWDTRPDGDTDDVRYGNTTFNGRPAFCVDYAGSDYNGIGYFSQHTDKRNTHQLVLVDRSDTGAGNFDICFNWNKTEWDTGDASGGVGGIGGIVGHPARVGWSNGDVPGPGQPLSTSTYEEPGSGVSGAFLDSNPNGLAYRTNVDLPGRKCFGVRGGEPSEGKISARGTVQTIQGPTIGFSAANDCLAALSTRPSVVGLPAGGRIWTKTTVTESECSDTGRVSLPHRFDTQTGTATGTFGAAAPGGLSGQSGELRWTYFDGSPDTDFPDSVQFILRDSADNIVYEATVQTPGTFRGSPGGVWTFGP